MRSPLIIIAILAIATSAHSATHEETQRFLHGLRHAQCPYALPYETTLAEIGKVVDLGFDAVGIVFVGPYNDGKIDFSTLDQALDLLGKRGQRAVLHIMPRFAESDGVSDRLSDGAVIRSIWDRCPNYGITDVFDPRQRRKFDDWVSRCAERYGHDPRVVGFVIGWGYQGETGFYNGDWVTNWNGLGSVCAGYSSYALAEFNRWRKVRGLASLGELPLPTTGEQSDDYILFQRFRTEFVRDVFQAGYIDAAKAHTSVPVGLFGYVSCGVDNYSRNWVDSPNADFLRTAGSSSSYDMTRTLIDSGIGWEDWPLHDGTWDFTSACMIRDEARQMARGGVFHAMYVRIYETEPQWERGVFGKVASFLRTQDLSRKLRRPNPTVALFIPTWSVAAIPARGEAQAFLPRADYGSHLTKMVGLVESFGLPYRQITEADLLDPSRLAGFGRIIVPMWNLLPKALGRREYDLLAKDTRVIGIPLAPTPLTRGQFRDLLTTHRVKTNLDFQSDLILAGRYGNLVYNWDSKPIRVRIPEHRDEIELGPYEYRIAVSR